MSILQSAYSVLKLPKSHFKAWNVNNRDIGLPGFRLAVSEWGSNGLIVFSLRGPNGVTESPSTPLIFLDT